MAGDVAPNVGTRNNNGGKFTELSFTLERAVATQRSWKNTDDEWASKTEWHVKAQEVQFHHEVYNQFLWNLF